MANKGVRLGNLAINYGNYSMTLVKAYCMAQSLLPILSK